MDRPTYDQAMASARLAQKQGRTDKAVGILSALDQRERNLAAAQDALIADVRGFWRDTVLIEDLCAGLGTTRTVFHRGYAHLDAIEPGLADMRGAYGYLRRRLSPEAAGARLAAMEAHDALSLGDAARARELVKTLPRDAFPLGWHMVDARLALIEGAFDRAAESSIMAMVLSCAGGEATDLYCRVLLRKGRVADATAGLLRMPDRSAWRGASWTGNFTRPLLPWRILHALNRRLANASVAETMSYARRIYWFACRNQPELQAFKARLRRLLCRR